MYNNVYFNIITNETLSTLITTKRKKDTVDTTRKCYTKRIKYSCLVFYGTELTI